MPKAKRPRTTSTSRQDEYEALFIERFGEAAWAAERARDAAEAALYAGCKVQAFLDDPITEHYGAHNLAGMIRCDCAGCTRDRQQPTPSDLGQTGLEVLLGSRYHHPENTTNLAKGAHTMPTRVEGSFDDPQRNQATATHATKVTTPPTPSPAAPATHISWDLSNPLHRLRRPDQTHVTTKCGRRTPLDRIDDSAPTCADCTTAMRTAAIELLASIRDPRFERGCVQDAARILYRWADARVPDDPRIAPDVRDEVATLLADWAVHNYSKR